MDVALFDGQYGKFWRQENVALQSPVRREVVSEWTPKFPARPIDESLQDTHQDTGSNLELEAPMVGKQYLLKTPTLAIMSREGQRFPMTIPHGGIVLVTARNHNDNHLVDVEWEGRPLTIPAGYFKLTGDANSGTAGWLQVSRRIAARIPAPDGDSAPADS